MLSILLIAFSLVPSGASKSCVTARHMDGTHSLLCEGRRVARWDSLGNGRVWTNTGMVLIYEYGQLVDAL